MTRLAARLDECVEERVGAARAADGELATGGVIGVVALDMPLGAAERGQHVLVGPAG